MALRKNTKRNLTERETGIVVQLLRKFVNSEESGGFSINVEATNTVLTNLENYVEAIVEERERAKADVETDVEVEVAESTSSDSDEDNEDDEDDEVESSECVSDDDDSEFD